MAGSKASTATPLISMRFGPTVFLLHRTTQAELEEEELLLCELLLLDELLLDELLLLDETLEDELEELLQLDELLEDLDDELDD